jgi:hypothetical protein
MIGGQEEVEVEVDTLRQSRYCEGSDCEDTEIDLEELQKFLGS